jgi:hypothetical protein
VTVHGSGTGRTATRSPSGKATNHDGSLERTSESPCNRLGNGSEQFEKVHGQNDGHADRVALSDLSEEAAALFALGNPEKAD